MFKAIQINVKFFFHHNLFINGIVKLELSNKDMYKKNFLDKLSVLNCLLLKTLIMFVPLVILFHKDCFCIENM